jgi:hypothetical protein
MARDLTHAAVLITGLYGTGKTTLVEEMASILEDADVPYAAIDLDWLAWANVEDGHGPAGHRLMVANLAAVVGNQRAAGMTRFLLAGKLDSASDIEDIRMALDMPMRVVRLVASLEVIERRLAGHSTSGRHDDLEQARRGLASGIGAGLGDLVVDSDRPIRAVADEILGWLGWV